MIANRAQATFAKPLFMGLVVGALLAASAFPMATAASPADAGFQDTSRVFQISDTVGPPPSFLDIYKKPDLVVANVDITGLGNCQWRIDAVIENRPLFLLGVPLGAAAGPFDTVLLADGAVVDLAPVSGLGLGASTTLTFFVSGERSIRVSADWGKTVKERAEFNNNSTLQHLVC